MGLFAGYRSSNNKDIFAYLPTFTYLHNYTLRTYIPFTSGSRKFQCTGGMDTLNSLRAFEQEARMCWVSPVSVSGYECPMGSKEMASQGGISMRIQRDQTPVSCCRRTIGMPTYVEKAPFCNLHTNTGSKTCVYTLLLTLFLE